MVAAYTQDNASIREIAAKAGRSYGSIHRLLDETEGVSMRERGGNNRYRPA